MVKIRLCENQLRNIFEYRGQQRLPFQRYSDKLGKMIDDRQYSKKNQAEHYLDWLEEFGRYGKLDGSSLSLQNCIEKGVRVAIDKGKINIPYNDYNEDGSPFVVTDEQIDSDVKEISDELFKYKFKLFKYNDVGNIYVERAVTLDGNVTDVMKDLFSDLKDTYHNNVGGCWAFKEGMGKAYCGEKNAMIVLLKGYIRLEDIDWFKTCDLNYRHDEYEIRVNPNAKVELFEVIFDGKYKLPLNGTLIVSSTYFGNRQGYKGDFATVDDGIGGKRLINRKGEIINFDTVSNVEHLFGDYYVAKNKHGKCTIINTKGEQVINSWYNEIGMLGTKFIFIDNLDSMDGRYNFIDIKGNILSKIWFSDINYFSDDLVEVQMNEEMYNLMDINGNLLYNEWFYFIDELGENGIARITKDADHISYIRSDGSFLIDEWFENASMFRGNVAVVKRLKNEDDFEIEANFLDSNGMILYPDHWFSAIRLYDRNDFNKQYQLRINNKWFYADKDGKIDYEHPFEKSW